MTTQKCRFIEKTHKIYALFFAFCALFTLCNTSDAAVVSRTNSRRPSSAASVSAATSATTSNTVATDEYVEEVEEYVETASIYDDEEEMVQDPDEIIEDKTSMFDEILGDATSASDTSKSSLAERVRAQRAALDAADAAAAAKSQIQNALTSGKNACDQNLRACMKSKCGDDYTKCAGDTDTLWGTKLDTCRRDLPCTGEEYRLFTAEIKADRDMNARIASYNAIIDCGNNYNDCIANECGQNFSKCLGKKTGDAAIAACSKLAKSCTEQDSGLSSRMMEVFGTLRQDAEKQVQRDEERLYELRDLMRETCGRLGAMFDERTLDCVYTVNFYAGQDNTLYASKKAYAGSTFNCDQNWFGVDITTFKENAFRLTREQKSATSALLGSGVGMAVGAVTSGAIDRAIDRHKAERAAKKAEKEHEENFGDGDDDKKDKKDEKGDGDETPDSDEDSDDSDNQDQGQDEKDDSEDDDSDDKGEDDVEEESEDDATPPADAPEIQRQSSQAPVVTDDTHKQLTPKVDPPKADGIKKVEVTVDKKTQRQRERQQKKAERQANKANKKK